jgi:glucosamine kinase
MYSGNPVLVLGLDVGGTSSRALVGDLHGRTLGTGEAGGGNPNSHPLDHALREIATATATALSSIDPAHVRSGVLGMAGDSKMTDPAVAREFERAWSALGVTCPMRVVGDSEVAFAAGTPNPAGTVLIAGTGAIAGRIDRHRLVTTAGGYGWLLGDEGSAFWMGRESVREALRALDRQRMADRPDSPTGELFPAVHTHLLDGAVNAEPGLLRKRLIAAVNAAPPIRLAELAPLVTSAARGGDRTALDIVRRAAMLLADTVSSTRRPDDTTPIVLAGALVAEGNPVGDALRAELTSRYDAHLAIAGHGAAGAAWLAALDLLDTGSCTPAELHERYLH